MATPNKVMETGRSVILRERDALTALANIMDVTKFGEAVEIIKNSKSYLVVVGVGKSGHIGQKLAASFASTGTPAFFLHPTEASHGDLGMITPDAVLLTLSNSGESRELGDVLAYAHKEKVPVISITSKPNSTMAKASSVTLVLPTVEEACPNGLAPTTSTTNMLAMGDALFVAVMQERGFTSQDFGYRHPGGKLGLRLQTVDDWMTRSPQSPPLINGDNPVKDVVIAITKGGFGCVGVTQSNGQLIGIVTDGDLRRAMEHNFFDKTAEGIMTPSPFTVSPEQTMGSVVDVFTERRIANAFVVKDSKPVALVDLKTLLASGYV